MPQPATLDDVFRCHRHDASFGGRGDHAIARALPAQWSQAIAVEGCAHDDSVAESQRGRSVPGLEADRLIAIEVAHRPRDVTAAFPCVGHKAHQRLADLPTAMHQQLERVVERGRVRTLFPDHTLQLGLELGLACPHPRAVAGDGVDLAVVGQHAEWLREPPVGHRIGRVTLVKNSEPAFATRVA